MNISDIKSPADIKKLSVDELPALAADLRKALIEKLARHGGHVGPNLGFLEPTVALHYVFDAPEDKIVFDVSHQSYVHKMLTGRIEAFIDPAHYDDVTGYTNPEESPYDLFSVGHTSTSVALASGLAKARDIQGKKYNVVAVIGDGSLSGGEAFEGLDYAGDLGSNFIVVVNDNQMSIAENHGAIYENLKALRESNGTCADNLFKALGFDYVYVPYGNDIESLVAAFRKVKDSQHPVVVHIDTMKGEGLPVAEQHKEQFHYSGPFDPATGAPKYTDDEPDYSDIFSEYMLARIAADPLSCVITAGTPGVIGFTAEKRAAAGSRFIDVGIAEEQAVAMASGLAKSGCRPVFGVAATFLQRTYDQLSQDLSLNGNPATIVTFYNGVWGLNDSTHLGFFDVPMISNIPGILFLAPTCRAEYLAMMRWAASQTAGPVVIATPGGAVVERDGDFEVDYATAPYEIVKPGHDVAIIAAGDFLPLGLEAADAMHRHGIDPMVINPRRLSSLDTDTLDKLRSFKTVITLEDNSVDGGLGQKIAAYLGDSPVNVIVKGLPKAFPDRYRAADILAAQGLTPDAIAALVNA
ncbi:MAG: 1-deoxy-D-xylulose-5-phosphate synthase [Muribaculaceae bacterium]|nr:1-deoxy-D-xylulose-5-phosphate synthase [Muribaculaceae bacterium]